MERLERPSLLEGNILYLILGLILWFVGSFVQARELYSGLLITEYVLILIPNIIYLKLMGFSLRKVLRLNRINLKQIVYIVLITFAAYPVAIFFNFIMIVLIQKFGTTLIEPIPMGDTPRMYLVSLFVIALGPGICEEVMFRGTIMSAYGKLGKRKGIIYSAILFGLFHLNIQNLVGPIILGIVLGLTVYKTNSLYASIIGHSLNNAIAVTIGYLSTKFMENIGEVELTDLGTPALGEYISTFLTLGILAIASTIALVKLLKGLPEGKENIDRPIYRKGRLVDYLPILPILALFIYINKMIFFT